MRLKDWLAFAGLSLAWGSSFLWIKIAVEEIGPFTLVALRLLFGVLGLLVVVALRGPDWPRDGKVWRALAVMGVANVAVPFVLISWGEQFIDSAVAAVLNSTVPLFTTVIAHNFLSDDRLTAGRGVGLVVGFAGVVILVARGLGGGFRENLLGQGAVLLAAMFYAGSSVFFRRTTPSGSPIEQALVQVLTADLLLWSVTPLAESPLTLPARTITWVALLWLGLVGSCLAYILYFYLLHAVGPTRATMVAYTFPLVGVILGVVFLSEVADWNLLAGGGLVLGSLTIVNRQGG